MTTLTRADRVTWDLSEGAAHYRVQLRDQNGVMLNEVTNVVETFIDGLTLASDPSHDGTLRRVQIWAIDSVGRESSPGTLANITVSMNPSQPGNIQIEPIPE